MDSKGIGCYRHHLSWLGGLLLLFCLLHAGQARGKDDLQQRDSEAQFEVGVMHIDGRGVTQNNEEAVKWLRLATEQGYAPAQYFLGLMYADGRGVTQDYEDALKWYR
jgi:TPR repeat protein